MIKMKKTRFSKKLLWWLIPSALVIAFGVYALIELFVSGLIPAQYAVLAAIVYAIIAGLAIFLIIRRFKTRKRSITAKTIAIILLVLMLLVSSAGLYVLKRGLSVLDGITNGANSVNLETSHTFNIFISGIDTYGDISNQSRSDVNIVATVNPDKHTVLLTTLPRDSYVSIALGGHDGMDKLTHAGNYGVESSMATVARVLDTDINAYIRINFTSFIESIDTLGGVTINNPTAFTIDGESFPVGKLQLNGKRALLYSRERKSLEGGDVDRGKNQQRVIQAIIDKITEIHSISGFEALLNLINTSVQTNISSGTMKGLINQQISDPSKWTTTSYTLKGKGQTGGLPSYAMPNSQLYMYVLDQSSVEKAQQDIQAQFK